MSFFVQLLMVPYVLRQMTRRSHSYLDGGTGSMLLQVLLGGTAGIAVLGRMFWRQVTGVFRFNRESTGDAPASDE